MLNRISYPGRSGFHFQWLFALSLAFGFVVFSGHNRIAEEVRPHPQQVEVLLSNPDQAENNAVSDYEEFVPEYSQEELKRSKEYELSVQSVCQMQIRITIKSVTERTLAFPSPLFFMQGSGIPHSSEESPSPVSG